MAVPIAKIDPTLASETAELLLKKIQESAGNFTSPDDIKSLADAFVQVVQNTATTTPGAGRQVLAR